MHSTKELAFDHRESNISLFLYAFDEPRNQIFTLQCILGIGGVVLCVLKKKILICEENVTDEKSLRIA